ncbi:hypothetical protein HNH97_17370 [Gluconacetobacter entanii]|nr:hypothetical protein [Gluconacetobacter entanii]
MILPGVVIGDDAVIGTGSVVTQDVPSGLTVTDNPARPLHAGRGLRFSVCLICPGHMIMVPHPTFPPEKKTSRDG